MLHHPLIMLLTGGKAEDLLLLSLLHKSLILLVTVVRTQQELYFLFVGKSSFMLLDLRRSAFSGLSSSEKVSRKPKHLNTVWFYCCF